MGSSALDPEYVFSDSSEYPSSYLYISPFDSGYTLVPRYNGLFDPFGKSKLTELLIASANRERSSPSSPPNGGGAFGSNDGPDNQNSGGHGSMPGRGQGGNDGNRTPSAPQSFSQGKEQQYQAEPANQKSRYERLFDGRSPGNQVEQVCIFFKINI